MPFLRIFLLLLFFLSPSYAQTAEQLTEKALSASDAQNHDKAGRLFMEAAEKYREAGQPVEQALLYHEAALSFFQLQKPEALGRATELLAKSASLYENNSKPMEAVRERLEQANVLVILKRLEEAQRVITKALSLLEEQPNPDKELLYLCKQRLASILDAGHRWTEALTVYLDVLEMAKESDPEQVPEYQVTMAIMNQLLGYDKLAVEYYLSGISGHQQFGHTLEKQEAQKRLASFFVQRRRFQEALPLYESLVKEVEDPRKVLDARFRMAKVYEGMEQPDKALNIMGEIRAELKDVASRRTVDRYRMKLLWATGQDQSAQSLLTSEAFADDYQRAIVAADSERRALAKEYFQSYIDSLKVEERPPLYNLFGLRLLQWGEAEAAEKTLRAGLKILGSKQGQTWAQLNSNLGESFLKRGEPEAALEHFEKALVWFENNAKPESYATLLNNMSACYSDLGNFSKSVAYLEKAVAVMDTTSERHPLKATLLNALGISYEELGRYDDAVIFHRRALATHRALGNPKGERTVLFNLGALLTSQGKRAEGDRYLTQSLEQALEAKDTELFAQLLGFVFETTKGAETRAAILAEAEKVIPNIENKIVKALFLNQKSKILVESGDWQGARSLAYEALSLFPNDSRIGQASFSRDLLLRSSLGLKDLDQARSWSKPLLEDIETRIWGLSSREARSYMENRTGALSDFCTALLEAHSLEEAFELEEKLRSLGLAALTRDVKFDDGRVSAQLLEERESLAKMIAENQASEKLQESLLSRYRIILDRIEREYVQAGLVNKVSTVKLEQVQAALQSDEAVLEFVTNEETVHGIVITKDNVKAYKLGTHKDVADKARAAFQSVSRYRTIRTINKRLEAVAALILTPFLADIQEVKKLVIIPSDGLYSLPFAALPVEGEELLIDRYEITVTNSASAWLASRSLTASGKGALVAALGDYEGAKGELTPLPKTAPEAETVVRLFPDSKLFLGEEMESQRMEREARGKQNLHLATHGFTNDQEPLLSGLAFSDRRVTAADIFGWNLDAELAVLSACESSGFRERNRFLGLTSAFQYAGVRTLVVSLWSVSDETTETWMKVFYEDLAQGGTPSHAMRQAHLKTREKWPNPFLWAPFTTWGDGLRDAS